MLTSLTSHAPFTRRPPKKSREEVAANLVKSICKQANASLSKPIALQRPPTLDDLRDIFARLAQQKFDDGYGYQYQGKRSAPPDQALDSGYVSAVTAFCAIRNDRDKLNVIENFVNKELVPSEYFPSWALGQAQEALTDKCDNLTRLLGYSDSWSSADFVRTYARSNSEDKYLHSIRTNAVFIYVNGSLEEEDVSATINALYYMGVHYMTLSAAKLASDSLFNLVFEHARTLAKNIPLSSPPTMEDLQMILLAYQNEQFVKDFGFDYDSTPPKVFHDRVHRTSHLLAYDDDDTSSVDDDIKKEILSPMPPWIPQDARKALLHELNSCIKAGPYDDGYSWEGKKVDHTYFSSPRKPAIIQNSDFVWCNAFSRERRDVSVKYLFYFGVFYEAAPGKSVVFEDLIKMLCNSAQQLLSQPKVISDHPSPDDLKGILLTACDDNFLKNFKFVFKGKETEPIDGTPGSPVYASKVSFNSSHIKEDSASLFVETIMRSLDLPKWPDERALLRSVRDDLLRQVRYCFATDTSNEFRVSSPFDMQYDYSDSGDNVLATNALLLYSNASLSEPSQNNAAVDMHIIYYVGVYYNAPNDGGW